MTGLPENQSLAAVTLRQFVDTRDGCFLDNADADTLREMVRLASGGSGEAAVETLARELWNRDQDGPGLTWEKARGEHDGYRQEARELLAKVGGSGEDAYDRGFRAGVAHANALGGASGSAPAGLFTEADLRMFDEWAKFTYTVSAGYWGDDQEKVRDKLRVALRGPGGG